MMDFEKELNVAQREAVMSTEGPLLVIAGAGTGKTRVIEYRVMNLVRRGVPADSILLLTFTRKAAKQMVLRAAGRDAACAGVDGGTFHSFANKMLRSHSTVLGLPPTFNIMDQADAADAVGRCAAKLGLLDEEEVFPRKETLHDVITKTVNLRVAVADVLRRDYPHYVQFVQEIEGVRAAFVEFKLDTGCLDYDDLLLYLRVLLEHPQAAQRILDRYRYVMVDEFQDTNALQGEIVQFLAGRDRNVMVVGDDAQSIYKFRGAHRRNILEFPQRFPGCRIITLTGNYRSTQTILDVANAALENMSEKFDKRLSAAQEGDGEKPPMLAFRSDLEEAEWIAATIKQARDEGVELSQQAVLFRATFLSLSLQMALRAKAIPFEVFGGMKLSDMAHVKDLVALLKIIVNPRDVLAWQRALEMLEGVGHKTAERLIGAFHPARSLQHACECVESAASTPRLKRSVPELLSMLREAGSRPEAVVLQYNTVLEYLRPRLQARYDDWPRRLQDLDALAQIASRYRQLEDLITDIALETPERGQGKAQAAQSHEETPLTLSTIHSAKGLEWDVVFLMGTSDGVLPSSRALHDPEELDEEHRLFYVAVTRARKRLYLTFQQQAPRPAGEVVAQLSRFVRAPNVLRALDMQYAVNLASSNPLDDGDYPADIPVFDRDVLIQKLLETNARS